MPSTSSEAGMKRVGHGQAHGGDGEQLAGVAGGRARPRAACRACGTKVMTRTCSQPAVAHGDDGAARSAAVSPMPVSMPSSTSRPARRAALRAAARSVERLAHAQARRRARACGSPGTARTSRRRRARRLAQHRRRARTPGETMTGSPSPSFTAATSSSSAGVAGVVVDERVLAHGEVEQHDAGRGEVAADGHDLVERLAIARALVVVGAVEAEGALVAAVGGEVDEPVEEDGVAECAARAARARRRRRRRGASSPAASSVSRSLAGRRAASARRWIVRPAERRSYGPLRSPDARSARTRGRRRAAALGGSKRSTRRRRRWRGRRPDGHADGDDRHELRRRLDAEQLLEPARRAPAPSSSRRRSPWRAPPCRAAARRRRCSAGRAAARSRSRSSSVTPRA